MRSDKCLSISYVNTKADRNELHDELVVRLSSGAFDRLLRFEADQPLLVASGEALFCLGLVPAMELGADLAIEADVDQSLLKNASAIQQLLCGWYPGYRPVKVKAGTTARSYPADRGTGLFFSGGVDSCYSLTVDRNRLSGLVTLIGADVALDDTARVNRLEAAAKTAAGQFGLKPIIVRTDVRNCSDQMIGWGEYHGSLLCAVRHMLAGQFETLLIASSADEASWERRWGSHPALDPLLGTDGATVEHHELAHRLAKIERIAGEPELMAHLRVCNQTLEHCGQCASCRFMLAALDLLDVRGQAPTYAHLGSPTPRLTVTGRGSKSDLEAMRAAALANGRHPQLAGAIGRALALYNLKTTVNRYFPLIETKRRLRRFRRQKRFARQVAGSSR